MKSHNSLVCRFTLPVIVLISSMFIVYSCEKEEEVPAFGSANLTPLSNSSYLAAAEIQARGDYEIIDHGFIYTLSTGSVDPANSGLKKSLGRIISSDTISAVIVPEINNYYPEPGLSLYVRAYITDKRGTMYSGLVSTLILRLNVYSIFPTLALEGDTISITGNNFNTDVSLNTVTFNNLPGEVITVTSNELKVIVPEYIPIESYWNNNITIKITSGSQNYDMGSIFHLKPKPTGFSPKTGTWNQSILISGSGLYNCAVYFDETQVSANTMNNGELQVYLPSDFLHKKFKIYLRSNYYVNDELTEVPGGYFVMDDMSVSLNSGSKYFPGQSIVVSGDGLNPSWNINSLILGNLNIDCAGGYSDFTFYLPANIADGDYYPRICNGADTFVMTDKITVIRPEITSISLTEGYPGTEVTISGTNLSNTYAPPSINLSQYNFSPKSITPTEIVFGIPYLPAADYSLHLSYSGGYDLEVTGFKVWEPEINSIEPSEGNPGESVIIHGHGFYKSWNNAVYFGNVNAPIMSMTDTEINVKVPDGLSSGNWMVQFYIDSRPLSTTVNFRVP